MTAEPLHMKWADQPVNRKGCLLALPLALAALPVAVARRYRRLVRKPVHT